MNLSAGARLQRLRQSAGPPAACSWFAASANHLRPEDRDQLRADVDVDGSNAEAPLPNAIQRVPIGRSGLSLGPDELLWHLKRAHAMAQLGSWEWNISSGELLWSDEIVRLFGLPVDAFGASYSAFLDRVHPDDRATVEEAVRRAVEEGAAFELEHRILQPDGEIRFVRESGEVERDRAGVPLRMRGIVQDVTRSRATERSATRNRDMLSGMFRISPEAIIVASKEGRVVIFSAGAEAVFGYAAREIIGESIERLMPERFAPTMASSSPVSPRGRVTVCRWRSARLSTD